MKYMLLVYDDEVVFDKIAKEEQQEILAESVRLTRELHANKQYLARRRCNRRRRRRWFECAKANRS
jgi:hypothetical protein